MADIPRKLQQIFGGGLAAPSNIAKFGSKAAGSPGYSLDLDLIQTAAWLNAWAAALINAPGGLASPALQDMNAAFYVMTTQIAYLLQKGMPDYLVTQTYFTNDFVKVGNVVYVSKTDNNVGNNPVTDTNNWQTYASTLNNSQGIAKAWVVFDGFSGTIKAAFNVSGVSRTAAGVYILTFGTALADANYAWSGAVGNGPSGVFQPGNDNHLTNGVPGRPSIKSTTQLTVFCYDRGDTNVQDASDICVQIFGT